MAERKSGPLYKIIGFALGGLIIIQAIVLVVVLLPTFRHESASKRLESLLGTQFPGAKPQVTGATGRVLRVSLNVTFDPTVDAQQAHECFERVLAMTSAQKFRKVETVEITLKGASLDGRATSATRTFDYEVGIRSKGGGEEAQTTTEPGNGGKELSDE